MNEGRRDEWKFNGESEKEERPSITVFENSSVFEIGAKIIIWIKIMFSKV